MKKPYKVCHVTSAHGKEDVRIFHKECTSLATKYDTYLVQLGDSYTKNDVKIVGFGKQNKGRILRMTLTAKRAVKTALSLDADIYHLHDPELWRFYKAFKKKNKIVIFDSHENDADAILNKTYIPRFFRKTLRNRFVKFQKKATAKIDGVVTVTSELVEYYKPMNDLVTLVANYPIYKEFDRYPDYDSHTLGFVGNLDDDWSIKHIINCTEKIPNCKFKLAGRGDEEYVDELRKLSGWNKVEFLGKLQHSEVFDRLMECSIGMALLIPSFNTFWEKGTMGNTKIFEEMNVGLPIICTNFTNWKRFVDQYHCGICVDPHNEEEIYNAIKTLIDNPKLCKEMGANGRRAIKEEFNWNNEEAKLFEFYKSIEQKMEAKNK